MLDSIPINRSIHRSIGIETQTRGEQQIRPALMRFLVRFDLKNSFACTQP